MKSDYILYFDLDGVLVDFHTGYTDIARTVDFEGLDQNYWEDLVHKKYSAMSDTPDWWANLNWIEGGKELWNVGHSLFNEVCILSSASSSDPKRFDIVEKGKRQWIKKNMPQIKSNNVFIVPYKGKKKDYASKNSILVDDVTITIKEWNAAGGFGILHSHRNYKNTIETLVDVAAPLNLAEVVKRFGK
jgi:phosphoglycolate phosphatase-like HAD superfamily hydrolase